jgi:hypothetical protein
MVSILSRGKPTKSEYIGSKIYEELAELSKWKNTKSYLNYCQDCHFVGDRFLGFHAENSSEEPNPLENKFVYPDCDYERAEDNNQ